MGYTYEDIVTVKDVLTGKVKEEDIIGKKGWFLDCIPQNMNPDEFRNQNGEYDRLLIIERKYDCPFFLENSSLTYTYFIPDKEESAAKPLLKKGDRVRIVKEWEDFNEECNPTIGDTGRIEEIDEDGNVKVVLDSDNDWWWYSPDAVELIEDKAALSPVEGKDKPAYIPFDLSREEDRNFLRGKWIKQKDNPKKTEMQIIGFRITETEHAWCCDLGMWVPAEDLLSDWVFLDGSPIGKPANKEN